MSCQSVLTQIQNGLSKYVPIQSLDSIRNLNPNTITLPEPYFNPEDNQIAALDGNLFISDNGEFIQVGNIVVPPPIPVDLSNISGNNLSYVNGSFFRLSTNSFDANLANIFNIQSNNITSNILVSNIGIFNDLNVENLILDQLSISNVEANLITSNVIEANLGLIGNLIGDTLNYTIGNINNIISENIISENIISENIISENIISNIIDSNIITIGQTYRVPRLYFGVVRTEGVIIPPGPYTLTANTSYSDNILSLTGSRQDLGSEFLDTIAITVEDSGGSTGFPVITLTSVGTRLEDAVTQYSYTSSIVNDTISLTVRAQTPFGESPNIQYAFHIVFLNP